MTEDEVRDVAMTAAREAVKDVFLTLGIDASSPDAVLKAQRDFQHLRAWRQASETVKRQGLITAVGVVVLGTIGLIWASIKAPV